MVVRSVVIHSQKSPPNRKDGGLMRNHFRVGGNVE